jgi:Protein of unknown function (DUF2844)
MLHNACMMHRSVGYPLALLIISTTWVGSARASLGGDAASVSSDAEELHAAVQPSVLGQFEIQEIVSDNGMQVREFLNRAGIVFAVTWQGPAMPNLQQLLGAQFPVYAAALSAQERPGLHRWVRVATPELVVESDGHLRAYVGRSYLPALVPPGVSIGELR